MHVAKQQSFSAIYTVFPKKQTRIIVNILYSCMSVAVKFSMCILMALAHLNYVSTLCDITQKLKSYVVFLSVV